MARLPNCPIDTRKAGDVGDEERGYLPGDRLRQLVLQVPSLKVLESASVDYGKVLTAGKKQLAEWFEGRVVVLADGRTFGSDLTGAPGRR